MVDQHNRKRRIEDSTMNSSQSRISRSQYEIEVELNPYDYEAWHGYIDFEKRQGSYARIRKTFEKAIQNIPMEKKRFWWPDYIYLWLKYALFEETEAKDIERARRVYSRCIKLIPHEKFSFDKVWISAAQFEINQSNFDNARKLLESAIEKAPTIGIFETYIEMELELGNIRGCQMLYTRYVQWSPNDDYSSWMEYIEFEKSQSNPNRARFIYDLAISQAALYKCIPLWSSYIDFEISEDKPEKARDLFEKLLERTKHVSVWIEYARFEASMAEELLDEEELEDETIKLEKKRVGFAETYIQRVRDIFKKALHYFTTSTRPNLEVQARAELLQEWEGLERRFGSSGNVNLVLGLVNRFNRRNEGISLS